MDSGRGRPIFAAVGQKIRYSGLAVLAVAAWVLIAGEAGWLDDHAVDLWSPLLIKVGVLLFVAGLATGLLSPLLRQFRRGHCTRCGALTERGQSYCLDHLRATVNEAQDHMRSANYPTRRSR